MSSEPATPGSAPNRGASLGKGARLGVVAIVTLAATLRLWRIDSPPTDFPADRQITTALLIDSLAGGRPLSEYHFLHPAGDDPSVLMPEAPIVSCLAAWTSRLTSIASFTCARLWTVAFSLLSVVLVYDIGRRRLGARAGFVVPASAGVGLGGGPFDKAQDKRDGRSGLYRGSGAGLWAAGFFAFLPASVYFGRAVVPDVPMTTFMLAALAAWYRWIERRRLVWTLMALAALALAVLAKLYGVLIAIPMILSLWDATEPGARGETSSLAAPPLLRTSVRLEMAASVAIAALAPVFLYYPISIFSPLEDIRKLSESTNSLLSTFGMNGFSAAWCTAFLNRIDLTITPGGALLALAGMAVSIARFGSSALSLWLIASATFVFVSVGANTYWAYLLLPPACLCMGAAMDAAGEWIALKKPLRRAQWADIVFYTGTAIACVVAFSPSLGKIINSYYRRDERIERAGAFVRAHTKEGEIVATCGDVPFDLLWASGRAGWSLRPPESARLSLKGRDWQSLAVAGSWDSNVMREAFAAYRCVASQKGVALFSRSASSGESSAADTAFVQPVTPPVSYAIAVRLVGAGVSLASATKPTTLTVALQWELDTPKPVPYVSPFTTVAMRWRQQVPRGAPAESFRLPPLDRALNFPGEDYTRGQFNAIAEPALAEGQETSAVLTRWQFAVPEHFPPGAYRLEIALRQNDRPDPSRWVEVQGAPGGYWARLNEIRIPARRAASRLETLRPDSFFFEGEDYGHPPADGAATDGSVRLAAEGQRIFIDAGETAATRVLTLDLRGDPGAFLTASSADGFATWIAPQTSGKASCPPKRQLQVTVPPAPRSSVVVLETGGPRSSASQTPICWPLYIDEVPRQPRSVILVFARLESVSNPVGVRR